ncbi:MAG TPA: hypothetical protein PKL97_08190 [Candidatus Omnitrophota bacterium]|nr:hypothetical protein [Candidatus Omnitrophota bacterium]
MTRSVTAGIMRSLGFLLPVTLLLLLRASPCRADTGTETTPSISVEAEADKGTITIGELIQYTILIRHAPSIRILGGIQFPNSRDFEVKSTEDIPAHEEDGSTVSGKKFLITAYGLGDFVIDEAAINYLDENGTQKSIRSNRLYITVESVDKSGKPKTDIRPIKKPWDMKSQLLRKGLTAGMIGLSLLCLFLLGNYLRKLKKAPSRQEEILSPYDEAMRDLNRLFESTLIREGKVKQYYYALSETIKRYLERRFSFRASEQTTEEILKEIKRQKFDDALRQSIRSFLEEVDIVKFALYFPPPAEISRINQDAIRLVEKTKPANEIPEPGGNDSPKPVPQKASR